MNKSSLIADLKVERDAPSLGRDSRYRTVVVSIIAAITVLGGVAWLVLRMSGPPTVEAAYARSVVTGTRGSALLEASGYVVARREATVSSKVTGRVTELLIEEGQPVAAGQVIAKLDVSNVAAALDQARAQIRVTEANVRVARVAEANARSKYTRAETLHRSGWISDQGLENARGDYDAAQSNTALAQRQVAVAHAAETVTERSVDDTVVRAPFAGVVTVKAAQVGEIVSPISAGGGFTRTGIGTIVDMQSLEVEVDVAESYINRVRTGMPATVQLNAYSDWSIPAEVAAVIPTGDRSKATVKVRIRFKVADPRIVPEMGAKVAFLGSPAPQSSGPARSVEIPAAAVLAPQNGSAAVFVIGENLALEHRTVRLGPTRGDRQTVLAGLRSGERVAVGELSSFRNGMSVRVNGH